MPVAGEENGFPSRLPPDLAPDFPTLTPRGRLEIVEDLAKQRSDRASTRERIVHMLEDGDREREPALTLVLKLDPDRLVKRSAAFGLACIPHPAVVPGLRVALGLPDRATKGHAILAHGRLRARAAVPDLVALLDDSYGSLAAADALVAIGDERARAGCRLRYLERPTRAARATRPRRPRRHPSRRATR